MDLATFLNLLIVAALTQGHTCTEDEDKVMLLVGRPLGGYHQMP